MCTKIYILVLITDMSVSDTSNYSKLYVSGLSQFKQKPFCLIFWDQIHVNWNLIALQIFTDFACCNGQHFSVEVND